MSTVTDFDKIKLLISKTTENFNIRSYGDEKQIIIPDFRTYYFNEAGELFKITEKGKVISEA